jgi:hypothetical protein
MYESLFLDRSLRRHVEKHERREDDLKRVQVLALWLIVYHEQDDTIL